MLVIRSKCMLEKQAEGLQRSTGALPVHGCASDWPCLSDTKQGFQWLLLLRLLDGVSAVAAGCPGVPPRCCPVPPVLKSRRTEGLTLPNQWRWKISAIAAFCGCPSFPFPPLRSSSAFFFFPWTPALSWLLALLFLFSFSFFCSFGITWRGRRAGGWGGAVWGRERTREWGGGRRELLRSSARSSLVHSKIWHPLLICSSKNPSAEGMLKEKKKKNQSTYRASVKNVGIKDWRFT